MKFNLKQGSSFEVQSDNKPLLKADADSGSALIQEITWAALKTLRDNSQLIPGQFYRITDYTCTTTTTDTSSAGHVFDIIVLALETNKLSEEAWAAHHSGDTYFANSKLEAWQLWYSLDNDTTRFRWADNTDGKGVIYRMIDEFGNDVPYDFKNILFTKANVYANVYTFNSVYGDASKSTYDFCVNNIIKKTRDGEGANKAQALNFTVFIIVGRTCFWRDNEVDVNNHFNTIKVATVVNNKIGRQFTYNNINGENFIYNYIDDMCQSNTFGSEFRYNIVDRGVNGCTFGNNDDAHMQNCRFYTGLTFMNFYGQSALSHQFIRNVHVHALPSNTTIIADRSNQDYQTDYFDETPTYFAKFKIRVFAIDEYGSPFLSTNPNATEGDSQLFVKPGDKYYIFVRIIKAMESFYHAYDWELISGTEWQVGAIYRVQNCYLHVDFDGEDTIDPIPENGVIATKNRDYHVAGRSISDGVTFDLDLPSGEYAAGLVMSNYGTEETLWIYRIGRLYAFTASEEIDESFDDIYVSADDSLVIYEHQFESDMQQYLYDCVILAEDRNMNPCYIEFREW